jgi:hypothetical protein
MFDVRLAFAFAASLLVFGCAGPDSTLLEARAERRVSREAMRNDPLVAIGLRIRNDSPATLRSIRATMTMAIHDPWQGPPSLPPAGWKAPISTITRRWYANVDIAPGGEAFLLCDEREFPVSVSIEAVEAGSKAFTPWKGDDWEQATISSDITPATLRRHIVREDSADRFNLPIEKRWTFEPMSIALPVVARRSR